MKSRPHLWTCAALALLLAIPVCGQAPRPRQTVPVQPPTKSQQKPKDQRIRVEVNLVTIVASVLDKNNRPVPDLPKEAFEVYEEGLRQNVEIFEAETSQPLDLALMIDSSLSTFKELAFEREAAAHFVRQVVRPDDRLSVYQFSETVSQLSGFSSDVAALQAAVRSVGGGAATALYDAVYLGSEALVKRPPGRRRVIVLVTDAGETSSEVTFEQARRAAIVSEAMLYTILIRPVKNESGRNTAGEHALANITDATGGTMFYPDSVADLNAIFDRIDRELRTQYRLGYYPSPKPPARSFRRVEVRVACSPALAGCSAPAGVAAGGTPQPVPKPGDAAKPPEGFVLRHRKGYYTEEP